MRRLFFSLGACLGLLLVMLVATAEAITTECVEGCVNLMKTDLYECGNYWLDPIHYSESSYAECVAAAASHGTVCLKGCNTASGGKAYVVNTPSGQYKWYNPNELVTLSAGLKEGPAYIHGVGPTLHAEAYLLELTSALGDTTTPFENHNWLPVGPLTCDGDSLWQVPVDMSSFTSSIGYIARYDFTLQSDTTYIWVSSLISRSLLTAVPVGSNSPLNRLSFGPNPAHDRTLISFNTPKARQVSVTIYDVLGRRLRGWSWSNMSAGEHQVTWNWESDTGRPAPSTIVFCRLTVDGKSVARQMVHLK